MRNIKNRRELYNYCSKISDGYSEEEFDTFINQIVNTKQKIQELSDDNLGSISGGEIEEGVANNFPLKSGIPDTPEDNNNLRNTGKPESSWLSSLNSASRIIAGASSFIELAEVLYSDDFEAIPIEKIAFFVNRFISKSFGLR